MLYDCHVHVVDPTRWQPATPSELRGTASELQSTLRRRGVRRAVIVQPRSYRAAHGCFLNALAQIGANACGVAAYSKYTSQDEIAEWKQRGVRGVSIESNRSPWISAEEVAKLDDQLPDEWHIELDWTARELTDAAPMLARTTRAFVWTMPEEAPAWDEKVTDTLLWWVGMGNLYLKIVSSNGSVGRNTQLSNLAKQVPDRLVWGSGWPHLGPGLISPGFTTFGHVLDRNAQELYGFGSDD